MTKKAQNYIAHRQAQLLGDHFVGKGHPGLVRRPDGVVVPRSVHSAAFWGDRMPYAKGRLIVETRDVAKDGTRGEWGVHEDDPNLVVTQAEGLMANAMAGVANSALDYIELGNPTYPATTPELTDTNLEQTTSVRKAVSVTVNNNIVTAEVTFLVTEGNGWTYTEAGLFTGPFGSGTMFARKTFNAITKTSSFEMRFTWLITFLVNPAGSGECAGVAIVGPQTVANETIYVATGGEASVAATFDLVVGSAHVDVFLQGQRLVRSRQYIESAAPLAAPVGGPPTNKGVNLVGFTLNPGDVVYLVQRVLQ